MAPAPPRAFRRSRLVIGHLKRDFERQRGAPRHGAPGAPVIDPIPAYRFDALPRTSPADNALAPPPPRSAWLNRSNWLIGAGPSPDSGQDPDGSRGFPRHHQMPTQASLTPGHWRPK